MEPHIDIVLAHFGKRGMKWGSKKGTIGPKAAAIAKRGVGIKPPKPPGHEDHINTQTSRKIIKKSGVGALSNKDLQGVVTRMNLEKQYSSLSPSKKSKAAKSVGKVLLSVGKQQAQTAINDQAAKLISSMLKK